MQIPGLEHADPGTDDDDGQHDPADRGEYGAAEQG